MNQIAESNEYDVLIVGAGPAGLNAALVLGRMRRASERPCGHPGGELTDTGTVAIDPTGQSSVPGLYIGGDAATPVQSVAVATGSGARAAYAINASLISELPESSHDAQPPQTRTSEV